VTRPANPASRILPELTEESTAFWTGGADGELQVYRCRQCRGWIHPPTQACWRCRSRDVGPEVASGRATVAAFTINHHPWLDGFPPPYIVAIVEMEESADTRFTTNIIGCDLDAVYVGMPVEVVFENRDDVWLPLFQPAQP
jgi:uncharacterized OB-fold protein